MCTKFRENPSSGSGDIHMFIGDRLTDRLTDKQITTIYGRKFFTVIKKLPPLLTTQILLRSFAPFAGGLVSYIFKYLFILRKILRWFGFSVLRQFQVIPSHPKSVAQDKMVKSETKQSSC